VRHGWSSGISEPRRGRPLALALETGSSRHATRPWCLLCPADSADVVEDSDLAFQRRRASVRRASSWSTRRNGPGSPGSRDDRASMMPASVPEAYVLLGGPSAPPRVGGPARGEQQAHRDGPSNLGILDSARELLNGGLSTGGGPGLLSRTGGSRRQSVNFSLPPRPQGWPPVGTRELGGCRRPVRGSAGRERSVRIMVSRPSRQRRTTARSARTATRSR